MPFTQNIITTVQLLLNDLGVFWPIQTILDACNEAQLAVFAQTKWAKVGVSLSLNTYDDLVIIPPSVFIPEWIEDGKRRYFPTTQRELEHFMRGWRMLDCSTPTNFVLWDASHFRVIPRPDKVYNYTLWGIGMPGEITMASPNIIGPSHYINAISHAATGLLLEATRPDLAEAMKIQAAALVLDFKKYLRNQQSHNIRRMRPGKRFDLQQSGVIQERPVYYPIEGLESN